MRRIAQRHLLGRAGGNELPSGLAALRAKIDDVIFESVGQHTTELLNVA